MRQDDLKIYLEDMQADFLAGRLKELVARFSMPVVVYSLAGVVVFRSKEEMLLQTQQYREAILALSVADSTVEIVSRDRPSNKRSRATVRVTDFNASGDAVTGSLIRYFLISTGGSYKIEMLEYLEAPLPTETVEKLVH